MSATIYDIAEKLGLHYSTVAYALKGKGSIKEETRELIKRTAAELGYIPNESARRIRENKASTSFIGVVVPTLSVFYNETVQNLFRECSSCGRELSVAVAEFNREREDNAILSMLKQRVSCLLLRVSSLDWRNLPVESPLHLALKTGTPVILFQSTEDSGNLVSNAATDWNKSFHLALQHLKEKGHRRIALAFPYYGHDRSFCRILADEGTSLGFDPESDFIHLFPEPYPAETGAEAYQMHQQAILSGAAANTGAQILKAAMKMKERPTAIIFVADYNAAGAVNEACRIGIKIPEEMAIISIAKNLSASTALMKITTVAPDNIELGRNLFKFIEAHIAGELKAGSSLFFEPVFRQGETS